MINKVKINAEVILAETKINIEELSKLEKGTVISFKNCIPGNLCDLSINESKIAKGYITVNDESKLVFNLINKDLLEDISKEKINNEYIEEKFYQKKEFVDYDWTVFYENVNLKMLSDFLINEKISVITYILFVLSNEKKEILLNFFNQEIKNLIIEEFKNLIEIDKKNLKIICYTLENDIKEYMKNKIKL